MSGCEVARRARWSRGPVSWLGKRMYTTIPSARCCVLSPVLPARWGIEQKTQAPPGPNLTHRTKPRRESRRDNVEAQPLHLVVRGCMHPAATTCPHTEGIWRADRGPSLYLPHERYGTIAFICPTRGKGPSPRLRGPSPRGWVTSGSRATRSSSSGRSGEGRRQSAPAECSPSYPRRAMRPRRPHAPAILGKERERAREKALSVRQLVSLGALSRRSAGTQRARSGAAHLDVLASDEEGNQPAICTQSACNQRGGAP